MSKIMEFNMFKNILTDRMREQLGQEYTVEIKKVKKNNGVERNGLVAQREKSNTSPAIYIDDFYKEDMEEEEISKIAQTISKEYRTAEFNESLDLSGFIQFERAGMKIVFKLINFDRNQELLLSIPHRRFLNLAIVYYYVVNEAPFNGNASILISNQHMKQWNTTEEELYRLAFQNTPKQLPWKLENMENVIAGLLIETKKEECWSDEEDYEECEQWIDNFLQKSTKKSENNQPMFSMYVLSNNAKMLGAACILYPGVLETCSKKLGGSYYVLPSSIHENILIPESENCNAEVLLGIVSEINKTQVAEEEVLADAVYYYSNKTGKLVQNC